MRETSEYKGAPGTGAMTHEDNLKPASRRVRRNQSIRNRRRARKKILLGVLIAALIPLSIFAWSCTRALIAPGGDSVAARLTQVVRDYGGGGMVARAERWWFSNHEPPLGGAVKGGIPIVPRPIALKKLPRTTTPTIAPPSTPVNVVPVVAPALPNEGFWQPTGKLLDGRAVVYQSFLRPDTLHTSVLAGLVWMRASDIRGVQYNGLNIPGGSGWRYGSSIASADYPTLLAAMNGGFRLDDSRGGYMAEGREIAPLVAGRATLATYSNGRVAVGAWGRDISASTDLASARQNLDLIVDAGSPVAGLQRGDNYRWGATLGGDICVWRSGVGVDEEGNLIYAAGEVDIVSLADVLIRAGVVRAMELDINPGWVSFYTYTGISTADIAGHRLLGSINRQNDRYLRTGTRDFLALFVRDTPLAKPKSLAK